MIQGQAAKPAGNSYRTESLSTTEACGIVNAPWYAKPIPGYTTMYAYRSFSEPKTGSLATPFGFRREPVKARIEIKMAARIGTIT